ncbi:hypothetical protein DPMN_106265 [Dreissena polymorpha]|uniref:Uncharacterized protein n=1 Tax=Dreissena polymorpha TaxID=45954 RepID=A0A9D4K4V1_DREPO|nr:hypothetical protein DPMN_106265 [Dreissena polymorpha]
MGLLKLLALYGEDGAAEAAGMVFRRMGLLKLLTLSWADGTDEAADNVSSGWGC